MKRIIRVGETDHILLKGNEESLMMASGLVLRDPKRIVVDIRDPRHPDPDETLFHELYHSVELELIKQGLLTKEVSERRVELVTTMLYQTLIRNGLATFHVEWHQLDLYFSETALAIERLARYGNLRS